MRLLLPTLVGLVLILLLLLLVMQTLCCPLVVILFGLLLRQGLSVGLLGFIAAQAAVSVIFRVAVGVGGLQNSSSGAVGVHVGFVGLGMVRAVALTSRARIAGFNWVALTVVANVAVIAFLGFAWGSQRVALLPCRFLKTWVGIRELLPRVGVTTTVQGSRCLTHCRERIVGIGLWSSLHTGSVGVGSLGLGHMSAQKGIWVISWS